MLTFSIVNFERVHTIRFDTARRTISFVARLDGKDEPINLSRSELSDADRVPFDYQSVLFLLLVLRAFGFVFIAAGVPTKGVQLYQRSRDDGRAEMTIDFGTVHTITIDAVLKSIMFMTSKAGAKQPLYLATSGFGSSGLVHFDPVNTPILMQILRVLGFTFISKNKPDENPQVYKRRGNLARSEQGMLRPRVKTEPGVFDTPQRPMALDTDHSNDVTAERAIPKVLLDQSVRTDRTTLRPMNASDVTAKVPVKS